MQRVLQNLLMGNTEDVKRDINLQRNPEGIGDTKYCPVCKKPIQVNEQGDQMCENFSLDYKRNGKCYWHRWNDGTNHWSSPIEIFDAFAKESPEFREIYEKHKRGEL